MNTMSKTATPSTAAEKTTPPLKTGAEESIADALAHLLAEQVGAHPCEENQRAIENLQRAAEYLTNRTARIAAESSAQ